MFATTCRRVNGRLRQKEFDLSSMRIQTDRAPRKKKERIGNFNFQNSNPVLYAPFDHKSGKGKPTSKIRIRKNQNIELNTVSSQMRPHHKALSDMAIRRGGAYGSVDESNRDQELQDGDFVGLLTETFPSGVVAPHNDYLSGDRSGGFALLTHSGKVVLSRPSSVAIHFPHFVSSKLAQQASNPDFRGEDVGALEEEFNEERFQNRAKICNRLNILQRQTERTIQALTPAFEALYLDEKAQESLQENSLRTPEIARKLIDHPLSADILKEYIGSMNEVPEEVDIDTEEGAILKGNTANRAENLMAKVKNPDWASHSREHNVSIQEIIASSPAILLATHSLLFRHSSLFTRDSLQHKETQMFTLRPYADRKALTKVVKWVEFAVGKVGKFDKFDKESPDPIQEFSVKVRKLMERRDREIASLQALLPGQPRAIKSEQNSETIWTPDDLTIIQALRASAGQESRVEVGEKDKIKSAILYVTRQCGIENKFPASPRGKEGSQASLHPIMLAQANTVELLTRMGFLTPWENISNLDTEFRLLIKDSLPSKAESVIPDQDEGLREDFNLPVYVIDDTSAHELDDGVSIETTTEKDKYWIHISIADPTAGLEPNDDVSKLAQRRQSSYYHPDGYWPMIPTCIGEQYGLRIDKNNQQQFVKALQISAKVDVRNGSVLDFKITLSRSTNIKVMTYESVNKVLTGSEEEGSVEESAKADLKLLHKVAISLEKRRREVGGAIVALGSNASVQIDPLPLPASPLWQATEDYAPSTPIFGGFPRIRIQSVTALQSGIGPKYSLSHGLVSELMVMAGRVTGAWASKFNLPVFYRGQIAPAKVEDCERLLSLRDEAGVVTYQQLLRSGVHLSRGITRLRPEEHFSMGISTNQAIKAKDSDILTSSGYVRVTSPLRRFSDMMNHWQIKSWLRSGLKGSPLFSRNNLTELIPYQTRMEAWVRSHAKSSTLYYIALKLARGFQAQKGKIQLPIEEQEEVDTILNNVHEAVISIEEVRITPTLHGRIRVQLFNLGLPAELAVDPRSIPPPMGTLINVKIRNVYIAGPMAFILVEQVK